MGEIKEYKCPSCGKTWELKIGCGLMHGRLDVVKRVFPKEIQDRIDEEAKGEKFPLFDFNIRPALCKECGSLLGAGVLVIKDKEFVAPCSTCGGSPEVAKIVTCPQCKALLGESNIGHWD